MDLRAVVSQMSVEGQAVMQQVVQDAMADMSPLGQEGAGGADSLQGAGAEGAEGGGAEEGGDNAGWWWWWRRGLRCLFCCFGRRVVASVSLSCALRALCVVCKRCGKPCLEKHVRVGIKCSCGGIDSTVVVVARRKQ